MSVHPHQDEEGLIGTHEEEQLPLTGSQGEEPRGEPQRSMTRSSPGKALLGAVACSGAVTYAVYALSVSEKLRRGIESLVGLEKPPMVTTSGRHVRDWTMYNGSGCVNWKTIQIGEESVMPTYSACATSCRCSPGCTGFNFQDVKPSACSGASSSSGVGSCYRWGPSTCDQENNDCWNNFFLDNPEPTVWSAQDKGKGCANWKDILLTKLSGISNADDCGLHCLAYSDAGCEEFGYQADDCGSSGGRGNAAKTCYLYKGVCSKENNSCWDQYTLESYTEPTGPWELNGTGRGCSNWAKIKIGPPSLQASAGACGKLCQDVGGCVGFGYQSGLESQCNSGRSAFTGACYLWKGECEQERNACWNNYRSTPAPPFPPSSSPTPAPSSSPTPAPTSSPTPGPTPAPSSSPTRAPTPAPSSSPTPSPTSPGATPAPPTPAPPTSNPTSSPSPAPTSSPTPGPTPAPSSSPTPAPCKLTNSGSLTCTGKYSSGDCKCGKPGRDENEIFCYAEVKGHPGANWWYESNCPECCQCTSFTVFKKKDMAAQCHGGDQCGKC